ncbi:MAG TPA: ChaN family lipoprotein [Myxococcaceae bacterium]|nr:ChaN family lipoprotein [Myxococcaceae bacterium]
MRESLRLHQSLYRHQKAQISGYLERASAAFKAYEARYRRRTAKYREPLDPRELAREVSAADVVYVGDYHTLRQAQQSYLELVRNAREAGRRVVMALEFIEGRHQEALDAYLSGRLKERAFRELIGHAPRSAFDLWSGFKPLFDYARESGVEVLAIDRRASGGRSLEIRDRYAARRVAMAARAEDRPLVLVLMGQFHVVPAHLPARAKAALGKTERRHLVVYQNCEGVYWRLAREGLVGHVDAVRLSDDELCLFNASPVVCQQSFLDYLEAEGGDEPLLERAAGERFREMGRLLGKMLGLKVDAHLASVEVSTPADTHVLDRIAERGNFSERELAQIRKQLHAREGYYLPRAKLAYLGSLSLNHAAEEAAHCVRHACVGERMERPRRPAEAFYARCLEEALGFFGSKVVNPHRRCPDVADWALAFEGADPEARQVAAFVLAHKAAETEHGEEAAKLVPLREDGLFHGVSHALGYLLGDAIYRAFDLGALSAEGMSQLFQDPFDQAQKTYFELVRTYVASRRGPRRAAESGSMNEAEAGGLAREGTSHRGGALRRE